jgi:hypothetical protein
MRRLRCLVVVGALAVAVCAVAPGPALAAKGGNKDTARACQKGGWKTLIPDAGGTFANQGDCVNDGAQGSAPFGTAGNAACSQVAGRFMLRTDPSSWNCLFDPIAFPGGTANLEAACATDTNNSPGATFETEQVRDNLVAICLPPPPT